MPEPKTKTEDKKMVNCTVLVTGTTYGSMKLAKGRKLTIPADEAKALEELKKVTITGIPKQ